MKEYLEKKLMSLDKIVDFSSESVMVQAELGKTSQHHRSGDFFRAEVNLNVGGKSYRAVSEKDDLYAAIDDVKDELTREVKADKDKHHTQLREGSQKIKDILKTGEAEAEAEAPEDKYEDTV